MNKNDDENGGRQINYSRLVISLLVRKFIVPILSVVCIAIIGGLLARINGGWLDFPEMRGIIILRII